MLGDVPARLEWKSDSGADTVPPGRCVQLLKFCTIAVVERKEGPYGCAQRWFINIRLLRNVDIIGYSRLLAYTEFSLGMYAHLSRVVLP